MNNNYFLFFLLCDVQIQENIFVYYIKIRLEWLKLVTKIYKIIWKQNRTFPNTILYSSFLFSITIFFHENFCFINSLPKKGVDCLNETITEKVVKLIKKNAFFIITNYYIRIWCLLQKYFTTFF